MSRLMKNAFAISVPPRNPQVSKLASVFLCAIRKKVVRNVGGKKTVRKGVPFSRYAAGAKICTGSGVSARARGCSDTSSGRGGSLATMLLGFGGITGGNSGMSLWTSACCMLGSGGLMTG